MPDRGIGLLQYVARLEKDKARLERELEEISIALNHAQRVIQEGGIRKAELPGSEPTNGQPVEEPKDATLPFRGLGNESAIVKLLKSTDRGPLKTAQIGELLEEGGLESEAKNLTATLFGSLKRLVKKGEVVKVGEGRRTRWVAKGREPQATRLPSS